MVFFFNDTATTEIYTLPYTTLFRSQSAAVPLDSRGWPGPRLRFRAFAGHQSFVRARSEEHTSELQSRLHLVCRLLLEKKIQDEVATKVAASLKAGVFSTTSRQHTDD